MDIKLLKDWQNEDEIFEVGAVLTMTPDNAAEQLVADGIAEKYEVDEISKGLLDTIALLESDDPNDTTKVMDAVFSGDFLGGLGGLLGGMGNKMQNRGNTHFRKKTLAIIEKANSIIAEYGGGLTLRQLYYQFVARGLLSNTKKDYESLGKIAGNARLAGLIDWNAIIDRTRMTNSHSHFESPKDILETAAETFHLDTRADQDTYIEVWIEKEALIGVIEPICRELDVLYLACRGYFSLAAMWQAAGRFHEAEKADKKTVLLHLGDHDPSGIDMTHDIKNRLSGFGVQTEVERIALNMNQVEQYNPPPNFAKLTDTRSADYITEYGRKSWELDALEPKVITGLIEDAIGGYTDHDKRQVRLDEQESHKQRLTYIVEHWGEDED